MKKLFLYMFIGLCSSEMAQAQDCGTIVLAEGPAGTITILSHSNSNEISYNFFACPAFDSVRDDVLHVVIANGLTAIGSFAFSAAKNITSIELPATVTTIDPKAFWNLDALTSISVHPNNPEYYSEEGVLFTKDKKTLVVFPAGKMGNYTIPESVETINDYAFFRSNIQSVTLPGNTLNRIGEFAFEFCVNLTSITIPDAVTQIGRYAFSDCSNMTSVYIGSGVWDIGIYTFVGCTHLQSIEVAAGNPYFTSDDDVLFNKTKTFLIQYPAAKQGNSYVIPNGVTTLSGAALANCSGLTSITIPASVATVGEWAFTLCINLSEIINASIEPQKINSNVLDGVNTNACILRVPAASVEEYKKADNWMKLNIVALETETIEISLDKNELYLLTGATAEIKATVTGSDDVEWNSSRSTIATVSKGTTVRGNSVEKLIITSMGVVTAISPGTTVITASAESTETTCTVTVIEPGKSTIEGNVNNAGGSNVRVNLYMKPPDSDTKRGIIGGYVLLATTVPNDDGTYSFEDLPEGSYQVEVVMDDDEREATDELSLSGDENLTYVNFTVDVETGEIIVEVKEEEEEIKTGDNDFFASDLKIYPNPFTDVVRITGAVIGAYGNTPLRIINTAGAIVHTQTITSSDETIHLGHLPAGMYFIRIENSEIAKAVKVIKIQ